MSILEFYGFNDEFYDLNEFYEFYTIKKMTNLSQAWEKLKENSGKTTNNLKMNMSAKIKNVIRDFRDKE